MMKRLSLALVLASAGYVSPATVAGQAAQIQWKTVDAALLPDLLASDRASLVEAALLNEFENGTPSSARLDSIRGALLTTLAEAGQDDYLARHGALSVVRMAARQNQVTPDHVERMMVATSNRATLFGLVGVLVEHPERDEAVEVLTRIVGEGRPGETQYHVMIVERMATMGEAGRQGLQQLQRQGGALDPDVAVAVDQAIRTIRPPNR